MAHGHNIVFLDNIANVVFSEGVVRVELKSALPLGAGSEQDNSQQGDTTGFLVMSLPAMLRCYEQLGRTIEDMIDKKIIEKKENS
jgi:hypothetical protein